MPESAWSLHPQLKQDTIDIGDLPLSRVLVIKDANYPWLLLVPRRPEINEIIDLDSDYEIVFGPVAEYQKRHVSLVSIF